MEIDDTPQSSVLATDLAHAESQVSAKSLPPPPLSNSEKEAVRQFCMHSLELKKSTNDIKEERKKWADLTKDKRKYLQDWIREQGTSKCFVLPREIFQASEKELSASGLPSAPPYLRLQRNTTDANITPLVAETAVLETDEDKIRTFAEKSNPTQALIEAIVDCARNNIRTQRESVSLSASLEKGAKPLEIPELPMEIAKEMLTMHTAQAKAKVVGQTLKARTTDLSSSVKRLQPKVAEILDKSGTTSQPVKLAGGEVHRIVKNTSSRASKVTLKVFEEAVSEAVTSLALPADTLDEVLKAFPLRRKECIKRIQLKLNALPKKQSSSVKLVPVKQTVEEDEESESED